MANREQGGESILLAFFHAQPVGQAIEAPHHALALYPADSSRELSVLRNAAIPTELAECCPFEPGAAPQALSRRRRSRTRRQ